MVGTLKYLGSVALLLVAACGNPSFDNLPSSIEHDEEEGGALHAARYEDPFLCGDPQRPNDPERGTPCPTVRPADDALLSCDAVGCHGNYDFSANAPRKLWGGEGPSCYTCHGEEWN